MEIKKDSFKRQKSNDMAKRNNTSNNSTNTINAGLANLAPEIFGIVGKNPEDFVFIVVLNDGEAGAIAEAIGDSVETRVVRRGWGPTVDHVGDALAAIQAAGKTPILVEIAGADAVNGAVIIDHHGDYSGRPAALLQVLHLLGKEPTRFQELVAANDEGFYLAMEAKGATDAEMAEVRAYDRSFQLAEKPYGSGQWVNKFTPEVEAEAQRAIADKEVRGPLTIIRMAHAETAAACDPLHKKGEEQCLLILSQWEEGGEEKTEVNFFGSWDLCQTLYDRYGEEGKWHTWVGGETTLPNGRKTGFFGSSIAPLDEVEKLVVDWFAE